MEKELFLELIWNSAKKRINPNYTNAEKILKYYPHIMEEYNKYKPIHYWCKSLRELAYCIIHNVYEPPRCLYCNNNSVFHGVYKPYCIIHNKTELIEKTVMRCKGIKQPTEQIQKRANSNKGKKRTDETRKKISNGLLNSPKYESIRQKAIDRMNTPEEKLKSSIRMKQMIADGRLTPNITNTWTHFDVVIDDKKFRSSFEGIFYIYYNLYSKNISYYEKLRIPYTYKDSQKTYIVDFIDYDKNFVFEIKPSSLSTNDLNLTKMNALVQWCEKNKFKYFLITENNIYSFYKEMELNNYNHDFMKEFKKKYARFLY